MLHHCVTSNNFQIVKLVICWQNLICLYSTGDSALLYTELALESERGFLFIICAAKMSAVLVVLMNIWRRNRRAVHQMKHLTT